MSVPMIAVKPLKYRTRHMEPGTHFRVKNEKEAKVLLHLKKAERAHNENRKVALDDARAEVGLPPISADSDDIKVWRERYEEALGKRPFNGWDIATLKQKIAGA